MDNRLIFLYHSVGVMEGRGMLARLPIESGSPRLQAPGSNVGIRAED